MATGAAVDAFYSSASGSFVMHEAVETGSQIPSGRPQLRLYLRSLRFSEEICQRSELQGKSSAKSVNHFLLSDSTQGSNLWNSLG